jgi:hypothetical protein
MGDSTSMLLHRIKEQKIRHEYETVRKIKNKVDTNQMKLL